MEEVAPYLPVPRALRKWRWVRRVQEEEFYLYSNSLRRGGLGSYGQGGQYWFLAGLLNHMLSGWLVHAVLLTPSAPAKL